MWFASAVLGLKPQAIALRPSRAHHGNVNTDTCLQAKQIRRLSMAPGVPLWHPT